MRIAFLALLAVGGLGGQVALGSLADGCRSSPASAPSSVGDATPSPPASTAVPAVDPCQAACDRMRDLACPEGRADDCVRAASLWDHGPIALKRPDNGRPLSCADVAQAQSTGQLRAMGVQCGAAASK